MKPMGRAALGDAERRSERAADMGDASPIPQSYSEKEEEAGKGQDCGSWSKNTSEAAQQPVPSRGHCAALIPPCPPDACLF